MSITETNSVDGLGVSSDKTALALLITDHLDWNNEYEHLLLLQEKINAYVSFIEGVQYKTIYPQYEFDSFVIEIRFKHAITENCRKFINTAAQQISPLHTSLNCIEDCE